MKAFVSIWGWNQFLQHLFWLLPFQGQALAFVRIAGQLLPVSYCQWKHWIMVRVMKQGRKGCNWPCTARQPPVLKTFLGGTEWLSGRKKTYQKGWVDNSSATITLLVCFCQANQQDVQQVFKSYSEEKISFSATAVRFIYTV